MSIPLKIIQVFEHQSLKIGDLFKQEHFEQLAAFSEKKSTKYFSLIHNGVKFSHYVGALQVGDLTLEILPKADNHSKPDKTLWQGVLLDMLRECQLLKIESLTAANLRLRNNAFLNLYFELFVNEVEKLLQEGLIKAYKRTEGNLKVLKGRLVVPKHLRQNQFHKEQFYTNHEQYDFNHLLNQIIFKALGILGKIVVEPKLAFRIQKLKAHFPKLDNIEILESDFQKVQFHRQTIRYQNAIEIARLLILHYSPDIRGGSNHLIAILFDMNLLFEEFVYRQLKKCQNEDLLVKRQQQKTFWNRRQLRPDILLNQKGKTIIIDTKWKILKKVSPGMEDLRQAYVYNQFFKAEKCVLVYPKVFDLEDLEATPFENSTDAGTCQVCFLEIIQKGQLNKVLGNNLLEKLETRKP